MYLKQFAKKINQILITHGFGKQTQFMSLYWMDIQKLFNFQQITKIIF